jgi:hypothetical protein
MNNRIPGLIITGIIIVAFSTAFLICGVPEPKVTSQGDSINHSPNFIDKNFSLSQLPDEIRHDVREIDNSFPLTKWEFNSTNNAINLYTTDIRNESDIRGFQGKQIGNYSIYVIHDREFETNRIEVRDYLNGLRGNTSYQINSFEMVLDPKGPYVELWVYKTTEENKKMDKTMIKGWKILVYPVSPPRPESRNSLSNVSPALL